jgi:hypothetical protein
MLSRFNPEILHKNRPANIKLISNLDREVTALASKECFAQV